MTTVAQTWRQARAVRQPRPKRTPLLLAAVRFVGSRAPSWPRVRSAVMQTTACVAGCIGLFEWSAIAGWLGVMASLFVLEMLGGDK